MDDTTNSYDKHSDKLTILDYKNITIYVIII